MKNFGGIRKNNLTNVMEQPPGNDTDEIENIKFIPSPYYSRDKFISVLHGKNDEFCILSLNCQSIHAKFDRLFILIEELRKYHFEFSAICLQETWLKKEADLTKYLITHVYPKANVAHNMAA